MSHWVFILCVLFLLQARYCLGMGPFFFNLASIPFYFQFVGQLILLPHHCIAFAMISLNCACQASFGPAMYFSSLSSRCPAFLLGQYSYHLKHSLAHFISLGILGLLHSFGHPQPIPFLHSRGLFAKSFKLPRPDYHILTFRVCWPLHQPPLLIPLFGLLRSIFACFLFLMILMGLLLPSWAPLGPLAFFGAFFTILWACRLLFLPFGFNGFPYIASSSSSTLFYIVELLLVIRPFCQNGRQQWY